MNYFRLTILFLLVISFTGCSSISHQETWQATPIQINNQAESIHSEQAPGVGIFPAYQPQLVENYQLENGLSILHYQSEALVSATVLTGLFIQNSEPHNPLKLKLNVAWNQIIVDDKIKRTSLLAANIGTEIQYLSNAITSGWYLATLQGDEIKALELLSALLLKRAYTEQELSWQKQQYALNQQLQSVSGGSQTAQLYKRLVLPENNLVGKQTNTSSRRKQLNQLTLTDLEKHFQRHFIVENTVLVIITPTPLGNLKKHIKRLFSKLQPSHQQSQLNKTSKEKKETQSSLQLANPKPGIYAIDRPHSTQVDIRIGFMPLALKQTELASIKLFATVLAGRSLNSRMQADLRENKGLSYSIYYQLDQIADYYSLHFLSSTESHKTPALIAGMQQHIDHLLQHGIPQQEFEQLKQRLLITIQRRRLSPYLKMSFMTQNYMMSNSLQQVSSEAAIIDGLSYPQFKQFLVRLKQQSRLLILAGDKETISHHLCQPQSCNIHWYNSKLQAK